MLARKLWYVTTRLVDCPAWDAALAVPFVLVMCINPLLWGVAIWLATVSLLTISLPGVVWGISLFAFPREGDPPRPVPLQLTGLFVECVRVSTLWLGVVAVLSMSWELDAPWLATLVLPWRGALWVRALSVLARVAALLSLAVARMRSGPAGRTSEPYDPARP